MTKDILREIQVDIMANRIMVMRLANAVGMFPDTLQKFQDECIKEARKQVTIQDREEKKKEKKSVKKNNNNEI